MNDSKSQYSGHIMYLTQDKNNFLYQILSYLASLMKLMLSKDFNFVLTGNFESNRKENMKFTVSL